MKKQQQMESLVRIASTDIEGDKTVYVGLTKIKGVSWMMSNAVCQVLGIDKNKKIGELTQDEIKKIEAFLQNPKLPSWMLNRRKDRQTGKDMHLIGTKLELTKEFDIRRLKKIKAYRGVRHAMGLPVRGQRTKSHFRKGKTVGVQRSKAKKR